MIWNVEGADAVTGAERLVSVTADSAEEAEQRAIDQGLLVSAVFPSTIVEAARYDPDAPPPPPQSATTAIAEAVATTPTVSYRSPWTRTRQPQRPQRQVQLPWPLRLPGPVVLPPYFHLRAATWALGGLAALSYAWGAVATVFGVYVLFKRLAADQFDGFFDGLHYTLEIASPLVTGALLHAAAAGCDALRDIAMATQLRAERSLAEQQRDREADEQLGAR